MTDLINKINNLESTVVEALIAKYGSALQMVKPQTNPYIGHIAFIVNVSVNYINAQHKELELDWKSWCVVMIKRLFDQNKLDTKEDIFKHIDQFIEHKKTEYKKYVDNIALYSDEYYRDSPFINRYIKKY
jgi:hypothetical protein